MKHNRMLALALLVTLLILPAALLAQGNSSELAATLEVLSPTVEVLRINTVNWIAVKSEAIVGVGDTIRTNENGRARITFFANGTDTELQAKTEYRIKQFEGSDQTFTLTVEVVAGQTTQRLGRLLDASSSYNVETPGMVLAARGTQFTIRVEGSGRSGMLVTTGKVDAAKDGTNADVPAEFGVRAAMDGKLSDVVRAKTFDQLDAALDGCGVSLKTPDDTRLNVRVGAGLDFPRVGTIAADEITTLFGVTRGGKWYRIAFRGGYGWVLSSTAIIEKGCAGLRRFPDSYGTEDVSLYLSLGDPINPNDLQVPNIEATPEAKPAG